jgi:hypothetical protein
MKIDDFVIFSINHTATLRPDQNRDYRAAACLVQTDMPPVLLPTPYNAQVRVLQDALPAGTRVGSVDKIQGKEVPVCSLHSLPLFQLR